MPKYIASVDAIALAAGVAKSVLELATPATARAKILEWWIMFDGVTAANTPVKCEVGRFSAAITTATTITPAQADAADGVSQLTVKHTATVEGAGTVTANMPIFRIPPTSGFYYQAVGGNEILLPVSGFWRMRLTAAQVVNVAVGCIWDE